MAVDKAKETARQHRHRAHKRGNHSECAPERECRAGPPPADAALPPDPLPVRSSPREQLDVELRRVVGRLDALHVALSVEPCNVALLAEARGQQRALTLLLDALSKLAGTAPATPAPPNPLDELRRRRAERLAGSAS